MLPIFYPIFLLPILYLYFLMFFCIFNVYIYIHTYNIKNMPTHTQYLILSCVNIALTHWTAPTHRERGGGRKRESPLHIPTYIPTVYVYT